MICRNKSITGLRTWLWYGVMQTMADAFDLLVAASTLGLAHGDLGYVVMCWGMDRECKRNGG